MELLKSSSKILAFLIFFLGAGLCMKVVGEDVSQAIQIFVYTMVGSGLLVGNKTLVQALEKLIENKIG